MGRVLISAGILMVVGVAGFLWTRPPPSPPAQPGSGHPALSQSSERRVSSVITLNPP